MPAKLNVGASRKIADGRYGSRGAAVHLEIELDHALVSETAKLHERIRQIFALVHQAVTEELQRQQAEAASATAAATVLLPSQPRRATAAQLKAIQSLAKELHTDLEEVFLPPLGVRRLDELTVQQASTLIDTLKAARLASAA